MRYIEGAIEHGKPPSRQLSFRAIRALAACNELLIIYLAPVGVNQRILQEITLHGQYSAIQQFLPDAFVENGTSKNLSVSE